MLRKLTASALISVAIAGSGVALAAAPAVAASGSVKALAYLPGKPGQTYAGYGKNANEAKIAAANACHRATGKYCQAHIVRR